MLHCNWLPFPLYSTLGNKQYITAQNDLPYDFSKYMMTVFPRRTGLAITIVLIR